MQQKIFFIQFTTIIVHVLMKCIASATEWNILNPLALRSPKGKIFLRFNFLFENLYVIIFINLYYVLNKILRCLKICTNC